MDRVAILNGEVLDEELFAEALGRTGISNYVERGLCKTLTADDVDFANAVTDMPRGKCYILHNSRDLMLLADSRTLELGTDGTQHVYICYDLNQPGGERVEFHVSASQAEPALPSLRIAEIDMVAQEVTPVNNFAPINDEDATLYRGNDIDSDGDGVVNEADSANHVAAEDVEGSVTEADHADEASRASAADTLGTAEQNGSFGADVDAGEHRLRGLRALDIDYNDQGWRFQTAGDDAVGARLTPRLDGQVLSENAIQYDAGGYTIKDTLITTGPVLTGGDGDGWVMRQAGDGSANAADIIPKINGGVYSDYRIRYQHPGRYSIDGTLHTSGGVTTHGPLRTGTSSGDEGFLLRSQPDKDAAQILPIINGSVLYDRGIAYFAKEYRINDDVDVRGDHSVGGDLETSRLLVNPDGDGLVVTESQDIDAVNLTPIINGSPQGPDQIQYRGGKWDLKGDVGVGGDTFTLPKNDDDPDDAEVGDMWYRADLDD